MLTRTLFLLLVTFLFIQGAALQTTEISPFSYLDVFELEYASDPQISPDGEHIVYRRMGFDIMKDRSVGQLWIMDADGSNHQKLTTREGSESSPRWSPTGDRLVFTSSTDEGSEIYVYWVNTSRIARLSQLENSPGSLSWSADGTMIAFTMMVNQSPPVIAKMPAKPKGAKWADSPRITDRLKHEADGRGYLKPGFTHIFVIPAEGGSARQLSSGDFNHRGSLSWSPDGESIYFSANRNEDWEYDFRNSEIYQLTVNTGEITALTERKGPDYSPQASPDGNTIAYLSYEDKVQAYQVTHLYLMDKKGENKRNISANIDRSIENIQWAKDGNGLYFTYDDWGDTKIAYISTNGVQKDLANQMGGTTIGRPYASGSFSVATDGTIAFTHTSTSRPADIALLNTGQAEPKLLTKLNNDLLTYRELGQVEEVKYTSSFDGRTIQGWIVKPPAYDPAKKYPLLVENHGGPILNYGARFSAEMQLYAAAGYLVFYPNPRGSTGYGEEFANLLFHNYPGEDYQDVMDGVDYLLKENLIDEDQLYVTGGSAGGIMTAWMVGKNNRFRAAVVAKPVVNWISKTLVADNYYGYANYRIKGQPWENVEDYWRFSPLSLVENIQTPTMVMVGMNDLRTPPSEAKQLYHALKLRKIETVLVEIPGASHGIASRPSNLITKIAHTLAWFETYSGKEEEEGE
ncbi:MAG: S9 family peptidase [Lewinella sp.]|uniref:S9 family peptidase n=1 Tax=Lewinella sp. TaxID=2004506 RepID=UPI003D6BDCC5